MDVCGAFAVTQRCLLTSDRCARRIKDEELRVHDHSGKFHAVEDIRSFGNVSMVTLNRQIAGKMPLVHLRAQGKKQ